MIHPNRLKSQHWGQFILNAEREEYFEEYTYIVWFSSTKRWDIVIFQDQNSDFDPKTGSDVSGWWFSFAERGGQSINNCTKPYPTRELAYEAAYEFWEKWTAARAQKRALVPANQTSLF